MEYAAGDVTHLIKCYNEIASYLKENKRESWIAEEMEDFADYPAYLTIGKNAITEIHR